ncbi:MAG: hypothetical protein QXK74_00965 [Candidatus Nitrosocaldaceae archaeon]
MARITYLAIAAILAMSAVIAQPTKSYAVEGIAVNDGVISVGNTVKIKLVAGDYPLTIPNQRWYKVYEPDGDRCVPNDALISFPYTITVGNSLTLTYPTHFELDTTYSNGGDLQCTTNVTGEYEVDVDARTTIGSVNYKVDFDVSFFVVPQSPIGAVAIVGSSIAALGAFMAFKRRN